jgi:cytokinesis protein
VLKSWVDNKSDSIGAVAGQQIIVALVTWLTSMRLLTRKLISEILTFLCHWDDGHGQLEVLRALDYVNNQHGENGRFDAWIRNIETTHFMSGVVILSNNIS